MYQAQLKYLAAKYPDFNDLEPLEKAEIAQLFAKHRPVLAQEVFEGACGYLNKDALENAFDDPTHFGCMMLGLFVAHAESEIAEDFDVLRSAYLGRHGSEDDEHRAAEAQSRVADLNANIISITRGL
jgi:hypothetical protein